MTRRLPASATQRIIDVCRNVQRISTRIARDQTQMPTASEYLLQLRQHSPDPRSWDWEETLARTYCELLPSGAIVLDVGAHTGRHVDVFVHGAGAARVLAVEPQPIQFAELTQRFNTNHVVKPFDCALAAEAGNTRFVVNRAAPEESGLRRRRYNDEQAADVEDIPVTLRTVDELLSTEGLTRLDFVKIDVEGAEIDVLQGGAATLRNLQPLIAVEYGSPSFSAYDRSPADLYDLAADLGYGLTDLLGHQCRDRDEWLQLVDAYYWDFLLVPQSRLEAVSTRLSQFEWPVRNAAEPAAEQPVATPSLLARAQRALARLRGRTESAEADEHRQQVRTIYSEILGREPDAEGLAFYCSALMDGSLDAEGLRIELCKSEEYQRMHRD